LNTNLLVDSSDFWENLKKDIETAERKIYIQTLSFEADLVGRKLSSALIESPAVEKKIIVDKFYTTKMINDRYIYLPQNYFRVELKKELRDTKTMHADLMKNGIEVKVLSYQGNLFKKPFGRNHKKMIVIDNYIAYVGGINFSQHNFEWHDMMLRICGEEVSDFLSSDFLSTWNKSNISTSKDFDGVSLHLMNGAYNSKQLKPLFDKIENANSHIYVFSPYITNPFFRIFHTAIKRGVKLVLIYPAKNNWTYLQNYTVRKCKKYGIELLLYQKGMMHLKAILIDEDLLIAGSSNFDYLSYKMHTELIGFFSNKDLIDDFKERIIKEDLANCILTT